LVTPKAAEIIAVSVYPACFWSDCGWRKGDMDKSQLSNGQLGMLAAGISLFNGLAWQLSWAQISLST